jgi:hypothetical protein
VDAVRNARALRCALQLFTPPLLVGTCHYEVKLRIVRRNPREGVYQQIASFLAMNSPEKE